jgi:hypothetical protein
MGHVIIDLNRNICPVTRHLPADLDVMRSRSVPLVITSGMPTLPNGIESQSPRKSDRFWFADGSVLVSLAPAVYKLHKSILDRLSSKFATWLLDDAQDSTTLVLSQAVGHVGTPCIVVPGDLDIKVEDFETLLAHLYDDS